MFLFQLGSDGIILSTFGGTLIGPSLRKPGEPARPPGIATDGRVFLFAWQTASSSGQDHDIVGAIVQPEGIVINGAGTPIPIAASARDERRPSVIPAGPGRFLIAYEVIEGDQRRRGGRLIGDPFQTRRRP